MFAIHISITWKWGLGVKDFVVKNVARSCIKYELRAESSHFRVDVLESVFKYETCFLEVNETFVELDWDHKFCGEISEEFVWSSVTLL